MRKRYILSIVTALGIAGYLGITDKQNNTSLSNTENTSQEADFIIQGLVSATFDKNGDLSQQLDATRATHYPSNDTQLEKPNIIIYSNQQASWGVKAQQGNIKQQNQVDLQGDVQAIPLVNDGSQFSLQTQTLHVNMAEQTAHTTDSVTIESDQNQLHAVGMEMNLKTQMATFHNQVRGVHVPNEK